MGKIFVLSVTDHEEYILSRIWRLLQPSQDLTILCHLTLVILLFFRDWSFA